MALVAVSLQLRKCSFMLKAEQVLKKYGELEVLKGVDISVAKGEIVSIVGSSGAGKSTLLHILGTLDTADKGSIFLNDEPLHFLKGKRLAAYRNKNMGFVFQFHHLLPEFTALENICIPGWIAGKRRKDVENNAMQLLDLLGLAKRAQSKQQRLRGGEQQRVALVRALINKPSIVFADEPTGNLDSTNARELHQLFVQLRKDFDQTFLIVTHNEELALLSDRVLHMRDGMIV